MEDYNKCDECLILWSKYCIEQNIVDNDIIGLRIKVESNAQELFGILKDNYEIENRLSQNQCDIARILLPLIEDFYINSDEYNSINIKVQNDLKYWQDDLKIIELQNSSNYKGAYEYAYSLDDDHSRGYSALIKWYNYCIGNEKLDDELINIEVENKESANRIFNILISYLKNKVSPNKEQCQLSLKVIEKINKHLSSEQKDYEIIKTTLENRLNDNYIWTISNPEADISFDKYYSTLHYYSSDDLNKIAENAYLLANQIGIKLFVTDKDVKQQYVLFGIFDIDNHRLLNEGSFDGYWLYYSNLNEPAVYRVDINGNVECILSIDDLKGLVIYNGFVLNSTVLYVYGIVNDKQVRIYRVYLPDKRVENWEVEINKTYGQFSLLVPKDSEHLLYHCDNAAYVNKLDDLRKDKESLYNLISKYFDINKNEYDRYSFEQFLASYQLQIQTSIEREYNILPYCYCEYDIKTNDIVITPTKDTYINTYK